MMAGTTAQVEQEGNLATTLSSFYPLAPSVHQPTPANCQGNCKVTFNVRFEHSNQLPVQVDGFCCHPEEHSQEEVVHECRDHSTEHRNSS